MVNKKRQPWLCKVHKKLFAIMWKQAISEKCPEKENFFKKGIDKEGGMLYNRRAPKRTGAICSLKIEQHEISSTEKCERSR